MKLLGVIFILGATGSVGVRIAAGLKKRCVHLYAFLNTLSVLENEITFSCTPLPQALFNTAHAASGKLERFYRSVSEQMEEKKWLSPKSAVEQALRDEPDELIGEILLELADKLGKYAVDAQKKGIEAAKMQTTQLLEHLEKERSLRSGTYKTLSICAGLAAVILLL